jgi:hypothetical protein
LYFYDDFKGYNKLTVGAKDCFDFDLSTQSGVFCYQYLESKGMPTFGELQGYFFSPMSI